MRGQRAGGGVRGREGRGGGMVVKGEVEKGSGTTITTKVPPPLNATSLPPRCRHATARPASCTTPCTACTYNVLHHLLHGTGLTYLHKGVEEAEPEEQLLELDRLGASVEEAGVVDRVRRV